MTRSKLTDSDKQKITQLFRESEETISQLATLFTVSSSTIRRILKSQLSDQEYDALIATKQEKRTPKSTRKKASRTVRSDAADKDGVKAVSSSDSSSRPAPIKKRRRTSASVDDKAQPELSEAQRSDPEDLAEIIAEIEHDLQDHTLIDEEDDALEDFDEVDDLEEEESEALDLDVSLEPAELVQVLPFSDAKFPKTCYLVVDRSAELITRPLQAFGELGAIPEHEVDAKTLPIFDNHRIARRFSHRTQRIVKVPNSSILRKTCSQLLAKGITRLLINGHVYSL
ncbi:hypothetical protein [Acaryochloris sp. IP29b_bin.137]|uniref:hypothetical protein n=1 Tax=Acaryochloris sp. IP29b_bin.137 TaxID=2969217 RepID=UPI0026208A87|nr:hypothetical protein [Acaryochloris sp. IP29b_bin.137]